MTSHRAVELQRLRRRAHRRVACVVCACLCVLLLFYVAIAAAQHAVQRHAHLFGDRIRSRLDAESEEAVAVVLLKERQTLVDEGAEETRRRHHGAGGGRADVRKEGSEGRRSCQRRRR
ncbi:hypothetical protein QR680_005089 [Steinernema hermaphroditum]|uniref:Uncharacterized protein n=1 Tax=Steinernema hermaphroditum TaxID=289476 RepID=A0AA39HQT6_9BILA|nr:hypothetical protein QR680_005089 [Steinernema hermaphroditum]